MVIPPYLYKEYKAVQHEGNIFVIDRAWTKYVHPETNQPWFYNEQTGTSQYDFPLEQAQETVSADTVPKGWKTFYCPENDFVWWWHEATDKSTQMHPFYDKLQTFGIYKSKGIEWNFHKLRDTLSGPSDTHVARICDRVSELLNEPSFAWTVEYYLNGDPNTVKCVSNTGKIRLDGHTKYHDLGNHAYSCFLNTSMELASGYRHVGTNLERLQLLFEKLKRNWPSLAKKWPATPGSVIKKGDVIEVGLAMANMHIKNKSVADEKLHSWKRFVGLIEDVYNAFKDCIKDIFTCKDGQFPNKTCLPEPGAFARLIVFTWYGMHGRDDAKRLLSLQKADHEIAKLMVRIGSFNWRNSPKHSLNAMVAMKL